MARELDADVYDTLEFSALVFGGIGQPALFNLRGCPVCAHGHVLMASRETQEECWDDFVDDAGLSGVLVSAGISGFTSDEAVIRINRRTNRPAQSRVPFLDWCRELYIVRKAS